MKRLLLFLLVLSALSGNFASYKVSEYLSFPFSRYDISRDAMGGAGAALKKTGGPESGTFSLSLPYAGLRIYNIRDNVSSLDSVLEGNIPSAALDFLNSIPAGVKGFMEVDGGLGISLDPVSFYFMNRLSVMTAGPGNVSSTMFMMYEEAYDIALSHTFRSDTGYALNLAMSVRPSYRLYSADSTFLSGISASDVSNLVATSSGADLMTALRALVLDGVPFSSGWAFPVSVSTRLDMPYGFSSSLSLNGMNGDYNMVYRGGLLAARGDETGAVEPVGYRLTVPMSLDLGFAWSGSGRGLFKPYVAFDIVDLAGLFSGDLTQRGGVVDHLKMGAGLDFLYIFSVYAGLDRGYFSTGCSFRLKVLRVDLTYAVKPYGPVRYGDSLDYLAIRLNLGWS